VLSLLLSVAPAFCQQADTSATDTSATVTDTTETPDPAATDTMAADPPAADTAAADTTGMAAADTAAADTTTADTVQADTGPSAATLRSKAERAARTAAEEWLGLVDAGRFEESWEAAAPTLQEGVSREGWIDQGRRARRRLAPLRSRQFEAAQYRDSTAQIPGGQPVVVLQYAAEYDIGTTREAVITTKTDSAGWKVAGYRVIPAPPDTAQAPSDTTSVQ
jgi:hypothetical protein